MFEMTLLTFCVAQFLVINLSTPQQITNEIQSNFSLVSNPSNPSDANLVVQSYAFPDFCKILDAEWTSNQSVTTATWRLSSNPTFNQDKLLLRIHLANGKVVIACLGEAIIPGKCTQQSGVLIDAWSNTTIANSQLTVSGSTVSVTFSGNYSNLTPLWATSSYEPPPIDDSIGNENGTIGFHLGVASNWKFPNAPLESVIAFWSQMPPNELIWQIPFFGGIPPLPSTPRPGDINGDGHSDFHFEPDYLLPGTGNTLVGVWAIDRPPYGPSSNDYLVFVVGHDANHNGVLEPSEVSNIIGQCAFQPGNNSSYYQTINGILYLH